MNKMLDIKTIETLAEARIFFVVDMRHAHGCETATINAQEVPEFILDPILFAANHFKVSKADYLEWLECEGYQRCGAITRKNTQCNGSISGGGHLGAYEWSKSKLSFCAIHGGESSAAAHFRRTGKTYK